MSGKFSAFMVGLGVLLIAVAGSLAVRLGTTGGGAQHANAAPPVRHSATPTPSRTPAPTTATPLPSPTPTPTPRATTTTARPVTAPPTTPAPPPTTTSAPPVPGPWQLAWSDEFDGSTLDTSKWTARTDAANSTDEACITNRPDNVFVSGGLLTIRARREDATCAGQNRAFTSADLVGASAYTYGAFEVRAQSPNGADNSLGLWPAFWLAPDTGSGEIDCVELYGGTRYATATQALGATSFVEHSASLPSGVPNDGMHTYRVEWEATAIRWYVDGTLVWTQDASTTPGFDTAFSHAYRMRLNFQVGGAPGTPDATTALPADFTVDYVRVYQR